MHNQTSAVDERFHDRARIVAMAAFSSSSMELDPADLTQDVTRLFEDLARRRPEQRPVVSGECMPVVDVFETDRAVEIVLDLPGVGADALRVLVKSGVVLIVGEKERPVPSKQTPASFHLVERDFGRFARAVRLRGAVEASQAKARLSQGELRITVPRREERRGHGLVIAIDTGPPAATE